MHYILRLCSRKLLLNDTPQKHRPIKSEYIGVLLPGVPWAYYFIYSIIYFIKAFIQKIDRNIMNHTIDSKFILSAKSVSTIHENVQPSSIFHLCLKEDAIFVIKTGSYYRYVFWYQIQLNKGLRKLKLEFRRDNDTQVLKIRPIFRLSLVLMTLYIYIIIEFWLLYFLDMMMYISGPHDNSVDLPRSF